jgi:TolB protein
VAVNANFPVWHPTEKKIAYVSGCEGHRSVVEVSVEDGTSRVLLESKDSTWEIVRLQYSPKGTWLTLEVGDSAGIAANKILRMPAKGGKPEELLEGWSHTWDPSRPRLFYVWRERMGGSRMQVVDVDEASGKLVGSPRTIGLLTRNLRDLAIGGAGPTLAAVEGDGALDLSWLPLKAGVAEPAAAEEALNGGGGLDRFPAASPEGRRIAFMSDRMGRREVWVLDVATRKSSRPSQLSNDLGASFVAWNHDGNELLVHRQLSDGSFSLWRVAMDGRRAEPLGIDEPVAFVDASPDGKALVYSTQVEGVFQLFTFDVGTRRSRRLTFSSSEKYEGKWSPEGRFVTYCTSENSPEGTKYGLARIPAAGGTEEVLASSSERLRHQFYAPDGRFIYVQKSHQNIYRMPAAGGALEQVTHFPESGLFIEEPTISRDGSRLVYCRSHGGSSLWLMMLGAAP